MKKNKLLKAITFGLMITGCSSVSQNKLSMKYDEGKVRFSNYSYNVNPSSDINDYAYDIWYLDSAIIIQYVTIAFEMDAHASNRPPAQLKTMKYVYFDLKNFHCQDYTSLDTANSPVSNYKVSKNEVVMWNFYTVDSVSMYNSTPEKISDSILDGKKYTRLLFRKSLPEQAIKAVVYLINDHADNLFHLNLYLDNKFSPLKCMRMDDYVNGKIEKTFKYDHVTNKLSAFEKSIFNKWELNAKSTALPLITQKEALDIYSKIFKLF